ncbi:uncharacterized protein LOC108910144 [Anoplophora glabripennis]|uniref:uncharacterized protein LOC108910144 n=1 Tax=Anoplophora glabripennis TaxID=217634 RepID=UPI0008742D9F|nr:uncharacterized protein LOC108910144 [Anoplophora glabripennis]
MYQHNQTHYTQVTEPELKAVLEVFRENFFKRFGAIKRKYNITVTMLRRKLTSFYTIPSTSTEIENVEQPQPAQPTVFRTVSIDVALFWAVSNNQQAVARYLLEEGFEYTNCDVRNNTPLDIAKSCDFTEIIELFPKEENDIISSIIVSHSYSFEEIFSNLKKGEKPKFFLDICNILCGVKAESVIKIISDKNIDLYSFMSTSDKELKELGINLPYQRNRILGGLYRFHKQPFHPKSLYSVPLKEVYSNVDMAVQLLSTIKQVIAMEASLTYIMKHYKNQPVSKGGLPLMAKNIRTIKTKIASCKVTLNKLKGKTKGLDNEVQPVDLITSRSKTNFLPWRKIIFSFSVLSLVLVCKIMK